MPYFDLVMRPASPDDLPAARAIHAAAFIPISPIYRFTGSSLARQESRFLEGTRLVALIEGQIVGTMQYRLDRHHVHLLGLAVHPDHQRKGIARRLIEHTAALAPSLGHQVLAVDTIQETGNVGFFERLGFVVTRIEVASDCVSDLHPELHLVNMERHL